ncbi:hypothetical protein Cgig2_015975 [Carnegiea gigantea]|uniref:Uncharacterized protein n=1 Tax=Carnegiea gigantea TaxID=171969 RepID=A0A9Q1QLJ9_9CARY|nr:hypothetical protein Cgig2_015975 [Carnegiea gigantea]
MNVTKGLCTLDIDFDGIKEEIFVIGSCNGLVCMVLLLDIIVDVLSLKTQEWIQVRNGRLRGYSFGSISNARLVGVLVNDIKLVMVKTIWVLIWSTRSLRTSMFWYKVIATLKSILKEKCQVEYMGLYRDMNLSSCSVLIGYIVSGKFVIQLGDLELGLVDAKSSPKTYTQLVNFEGESRSYIASHMQKESDMCKRNLTFIHLEGE